MNSQQTRPAANRAEEQSIARGYTTPRQAAILSHHHALMLDEDRTNARRDYFAQSNTVADLEDRLARARTQLRRDAEQMHDIEQDAMKADHLDDIANARWLATRTAARKRASNGQPAIRPLPALPFMPQPTVHTVRIPSRCAKFPHGSIPRNTLVETAWKRRRRWHSRQAHLLPAGKAAFLQWHRATTQSLQALRTPA